MDVFAGFHGRVLAAVQQLKHDGVVPADASIEGITLEAPKDSAHGDLATNAAMVLAKPAGLPPRDARRAPRAALAVRSQLDAVEIAGPGFINLTLERALLAARAAHGAGAGGRLRPQRHRAGAAR